MDLEERVSELEALVLDQGFDVMAMNMLLQAFIVLHPSPKDLAEGLDMWSKGFELKATDHGFETNRSPKAVGNLSAAVRRRLEEWRSLALAAASKRPPEEG